MTVPVKIPENETKNLATGPKVPIVETTRERRDWKKEIAFDRLDNDVINQTAMKARTMMHNNSSKLHSEGSMAKIPHRPKKRRKCDRI